MVSHSLALPLSCSLRVLLGLPQESYDLVGSRHVLDVHFEKLLDRLTDDDIALNTGHRSVDGIGWENYFGRIVKTW